MANKFKQSNVVLRLVYVMILIVRFTGRLSDWRFIILYFSYLLKFDLSQVIFFIFLHLLDLASSTFPRHRVSLLFKVGIVCSVLSLLFPLFSCFFLCLDPDQMMDDTIMRHCSPYMRVPVSHKSPGCRLEL